MSTPAARTHRTAPRAEGRAGVFWRAAVVAASWIAVALALQPPGVASAQEQPDSVPHEPPDSIVLHGSVLDAPSQLPLSFVYVEVLDLDATAVTAADGAFRLTLPRADAYQLRIRRFGYEDMDFGIPADLNGQPLMLHLRPAPLALPGLEVSMDRVAALERRLERRTRAYFRSTRVVRPEDIRGAGFATALEVVLSRGGGMLFECVEVFGELCARPRPSASLTAPRAFEAQVRLCVDEVRAWGGTDYLRAILADEVQRIEFYGLGGRDQVRVYTRRYMIRNSSGRPRALAPVEWGC